MPRQPPVTDTGLSVQTASVIDDWQYEIGHKTLKKLFKVITENLFKICLTFIYYRFIRFNNYL